MRCSHNSFGFGGGFVDAFRFALAELFCFPDLLNGRTLDLACSKLGRDKLVRRLRLRIERHVFGRRFALERLQLELDLGRLG